MFNPFKKFGLFLSKDTNGNEETKVENEKVIKYLYKNNAKRKLDVNSTSPKFPKRHGVEHRKQRKKSRESAAQKSRKKSTNNFVSDTEIYFISPEEIRRHRRRLEKANEKPPKRVKEHPEKVLDRKRRDERKNQQENIAKPKHQSQNINTFDNQSLTKKDIFRLLNNADNNILKNFFMLDQQTPNKEFTAKNDKQRKGHRNNLPLKVSEDSTSKKLEKISARYESSGTKKLSEKLQPDHVKAPVNKTVKRKPKEISAIILEDSTRRRKPSSINSHQENPSVSCETSTLKMKSQSTNTKGRQHNMQQESSSKLKSQSKVNPIRHKQCLVKNTFHIVDIQPTIQSDDNMERRKKSRAFRKYYKYTRNIDGDSVSSTHNTLSDSQKMYQDSSEQSDDSIRCRKPTKDQHPNLKVETNVSAVVVSPKISRLYNTISSRSNNGDELTTKMENTSQKSKIPVMNKMVELAPEPATVSKGHQKSTDFFVPFGTPRREKTSTYYVSPKERSLERKFVQKTPTSVSPKGRSLDRSEERKKFQTVFPKEQSLDRSKERKKLQTRADKVQVTGKSITPSSGQQKEKPLRQSNISRQGSKISRDSTVPKQGVRNSLVGKSRSPSSSPASRQQSPGLGQKKAGLVGNDGASSVWSRSTKRSTRTSIASKSDNKLNQRDKINSQRKYKSNDRSSAVTSMSNSTFESSKNATSLLLTKTFKDDEKLNRWKRRKMYSDTLRKNLINKSQKSSVVPPQVLEVRYLTVSNDNSDIVEEVRKYMESHSHGTPANPNFDDTPHGDFVFPHMGLVDCDKFDELVELPSDEALDEILSENNEFLRKDFSFFQNNVEDSDSSTDISPRKEEFDNWYDFETDDPDQISYRESEDLINCQDLTLNPQDNIVDSLRAPGSEESGYNTISSRIFFEKPEIKALFERPADPLLDNRYSIEVHIIHSSSSVGSIQSLETLVEASRGQCSEEKNQKTTVVPETTPQENTEMRTNIQKKLVKLLERGSKTIRKNEKQAGLRKFYKPLWKAGSVLSKKLNLIRRAKNVGVKIKNQLSFLSFN